MLQLQPTPHSHRYRGDVAIVRGDSSVNVNNAHRVVLLADVADELLGSIRSETDGIASGIKSGWLAAIPQYGGGQRLRYEVPVRSDVMHAALDRLDGRLAPLQDALAGMQAVTRRSEGAPEFATGVSDRVDAIVDRGTSLGHLSNRLREGARRGVVDVTADPERGLVAGQPAGILGVDFGRMFGNMNDNWQVSLRVSDSTARSSLHRSIDSMRESVRLTRDEAIEAIANAGARSEHELINERIRHIIEVTPISAIGA